jgi:Mg2+ and Co2+ transporter CorA
MKNLFIRYFFILTLVITACKDKATEHGDHEHDATGKDVVETNGNQALYNEVMKIHDEVMPKMDDIHKAKQQLKEKIANTPDMSQPERVKVDAMISRLDSAGESMMAWMREFRPQADSVEGEEKAREYLENEIERVKKVRENMLQALEQAQKN